MKENKYYYAYDNFVKRKVIHVLKNGYLISLITGDKKRFVKDEMVRVKENTTL